MATKKMPPAFLAKKAPVKKATAKKAPPRRGVKDTDKDGM